MLIPVNPSKHLVRSTGPRHKEDDDTDPAPDETPEKVGQAKPSGRSAIMNRTVP